MLVKFKPAGKLLDFEGTRKLWEKDAEAFKQKKQLYLNPTKDTDGYAVKLEWMKELVKLKESTCISCSTVRGFKDRINLAVKYDYELLTKLKIANKSRNWRNLGKGRTNNINFLKSKLNLL